jgi:hypothetical protein
MPRTVDIASRSCHFAERLFRSHVCGVPVSTPVDVSEGDLGSSRWASPKSATHSLASDIQKDIGRLDVSMRHPARVRVIIGGGDLLQDPNSVDRRQPPLARREARLPPVARRMLIQGMPSSIPLAKIGTIAGMIEPATTLASR